MKRDIRDSGLAFLLKYTKGVEIVEYALPENKDAAGTIDRTRMFVKATNKMYMPQTNLAAVILHEGFHLYQVAWGLQPQGDQGTEAGAYCMQQLFNDLMNAGVNVFDPLDKGGWKYARWTMGLESSPQ